MPWNHRRRRIMGLDTGCEIDGGLSTSTEIDVELEGASTTGADSSAAIQRAIDKIGVSGSVLKFPPGNFLANSTLDFTGITAAQFGIKGAGRGSTNGTRLQLSHATRGLDMRLSAPAVGLSITDIELKGNGNAPDFLVDINNISDIHISRCHFNDSDRLLNFGAAAVGHVHLVGNTFSWNVTPSGAAIAVFISGGTLYNILGNSFETAATTTDGIVVNSVNSLSIIGNTFTGAIGDCILFTTGHTANDVSLIGNTGGDFTSGSPDHFISQATGTIARGSIIGNVCTRAGATASNGIALGGTRTNVVVGGNVMNNFTLAHNASFSSEPYILSALGVSNFAANTNTPSGATANAVEIFDHNGASLGFIPVYAAQW